MNLLVSDNSDCNLNDKCCIHNKTKHSKKFFHDFFNAFFQVGVDPLLRQSIWKHLVEISKPNSDGKSTTIVITTHYIEEARQANRVGMMRLE